MSDVDDRVVMTDKLPELMAAFHEAVALAMRGAAQAVADEYRATAPRQTGHLASSAYLVTHNETTYGQGIEGAGDLLPQVDAPDNDTDAIAAVAVPYAAYVEYGTQAMASQPAFHPAVDKAAQRLAHALDELGDKLADTGVHKG